MWKVTETKQAAKELAKLPKRISLIYRVLVEDLEREGPRPHGWEVKALTGREEIRIKLNREYRVLILIVEPDLIGVQSGTSQGGLRMTASAILKRVRQAYPEVFKELAKPKLKLVENAILFASKLSSTDDLLSNSGHKALLDEITGSRADLRPCDRLKANRLREDLSQSDLAKRCKIPQANISAMEAGKRPIGVQTAKKLAKALSCDYRQLV